MGKFGQVNLDKEVWTNRKMLIALSIALVTLGTDSMQHQQDHKITPHLHESHGLHSCCILAAHCHGIWGTCHQQQGCQLITCTIPKASHEGLLMQKHIHCADSETLCRHRVNVQRQQHCA